MKSRNKIMGIKRIVAKKSGKHWTIYYIDITDKYTEGAAYAPVWVEAGVDYKVGDEINVVYYNGRYFAI